MNSLILKMRFSTLLLNCEGKKKKIIILTRYSINEKRFMSNFTIISDIHILHISVFGLRGP
jgi:hypothetical protein